MCVGLVQKKRELILVLGLWIIEGLIFGNGSDMVMDSAQAA